MFSPGIKRPNASSRKERNQGHTVLHSPITPRSEARRSSLQNSVPDRPSTGTPAPWAPRLSVLARYAIYLFLNSEGIVVVLVGFKKRGFSGSSNNCWSVFCKKCVRFR